MSELAPDTLLTLKAAAEHSGYTREALRQRTRRGTLPCVKGNDGMLRIKASDLADLPPPEENIDEAGPDADGIMAALLTSLADLRGDLEQSRAALDAAIVDRLVDRGRAERADAMALAERARAERAEARLAEVETEMREARTPWLVRVARAWRGAS